MSKKRRLLTLIGGILAVLVGFLRGIGGLSLISAPESGKHLAIGIGLIAVAVWLMAVGVCYIVRRSDRLRLWFIAGLILFWVDGIVNGFLLFGSPQFSGQIINLGAVVGIISCLCINPGSSARS